MRRLAVDPGLRRDRLYNGFEQLTGRVITNSGAANGTVYSVHDVFGNVIAELNGTGATVREYIWLPEAEISPTMGSRTVVDRPMAVVSGVNTTPTLLMVHVDHLHRPVKMTNGTGTAVWSAVWLPWGGAHTITGAEINDARFPGKWFQLEAGLHYNWHRAYDPSLGRYTQPDPLGFVDGPGIFSYASGSPYDYVDPTGLYTRQPHTKPPPSLGARHTGFGEESGKLPPAFECIFDLPVHLCAMEGAIEFSFRCIDAGCYDRVVHLRRPCLVREPRVPATIRV